MNAITRFARAHPTTSYFGLVFAISWGGILALTARGGIPGTPEQVAEQMPYVLVALFAGPSLAGLLCTVLVHGRAGLVDLLRRGRRWRASPGEYAAVLLTAPLLVAGVLFGLSAMSAQYSPGIVNVEDRVGLLVFGIVWGLVGGGFLEELGWTGFAVPTLRRHSGPFVTALIVGLLWGAWHYLISFWASGTPEGKLSLPGFLPGMVFYVASLPAYRVLMVWLHDRTESLSLAMLMHASFSASMLIFQPRALDLVAGVTWNLVLAAALWTVVGAVAFLRRQRRAHVPSWSAPRHPVSP